MNHALNSPQPQRGGLLVKLLLFIVMLGAIGAIGWVVLLPSLVVSSLQNRTGFAVKVDQLSVNPLAGSVRLTGVVVGNPSGWPEAGFVNLRQFEADMEVLSLFSDRLVMDSVVLDVAQVNLVKNQSGQINAMLFKDGLSGPEGKTEASGATKPASSRGFLIHHLSLKLDRLVYADYSGRKPVTKTYTLNLNRDLTEVDSVTKIISPLTGAALGLATDLAGRLFRNRPDLFPEAARLQDAAGLLQDAGRKTGESLKSLIQSLEKKKP